MRSLIVLGLLVAPAAALDEGDDQYQFVVGLHERRMYEMAAREAERFLEDHSGHPKAELARYRLALSLYELERHDEASEHFRVLARRPDFEFRAEASFRLAECALTRDDLEEAADALERVERLDVDYLAVPAALLSGDVALRRERHDEARRHYERALASGDEPAVEADALYGLAWCAFGDGRHDDVPALVDRFDERHADDPRRDELLFLKGESLLERERPADALAAYRSVREGDYVDAAWRGRGFALAALGDHAAAAQRFGALVERFPDSELVAEALLHQGLHLVRAGEPARALGALESPRAEPGAALMFWRAEARRALGDETGALRDLERALTLPASSELASRIRSARGDLLVDLGRTDEALDAYEDASTDYGLHAAAIASLDAGDTARARTLARRLLSEYPDSPLRARAALALGEASFQDGDLDEAQAAFEEALRDAELAEQARARIAWCRYLRGEHAAAAGLFDEIARVGGPEAEEALFMAGRAHEDAGETARAVDAWSRYLERFPQGRWAREALLRVSRHADAEQAERGLERVLERGADDELAARALHELAERLSSEGRPGEAAERYARLIERHRDSPLVPPARYGLAWCLVELGDHEAAIDALRRLLAAPDAEHELLAAGLELLAWAGRAGGDVEAAEEGYRGLLALGVQDERLVDVARVVVGALADAGRRDDAQRLLEALLDEVDSQAARRRARLEAVWTALDRGALDDAERHVARLLVAGEPDPSAAEAAFFVGEALFDAGETERALVLYETAGVESSPVAAEALYKEGFTRLRHDDLAGAEDCFARFTERHPDSDLYGECLFLAGEAAFRRGDFGRAVSWLEDAREETSGHAVQPKVLFRLGSALCQVERYEDAERVLADLARRFPDFENGTEGELWRARALAASGRGRAAREAFERVVARDRGVLAARARLGLGGLHLTEGRTDDALSEFLKVAVLYAHDEEVGNALLLAGQCLESMGDRERARGRYEELLQRFPGSRFAETARRRLGELGSH